MNDMMEDVQGREDIDQDSRLTIALFISRVSETYQGLFWKGCLDASRERDCNLLCFVGGPLQSKSPDTVQEPKNIVYHLANADNVDGLIMLGGSIGNFISLEEIEQFYERYRPLPIVSAALGLDGVPSLLCDNQTGMREAVNHLIKAHGYGHVAFVRGPKGHQEADERYQAYVDVLAQHGIALEPTLVAPGNFEASSGRAAVELLLDERKFRPGVDVEAIVCVDDSTALGVMEALQSRGIQIPGEVAVLGFDDISETEFVTPPLTTVRQPVYEMGQKSVDMLLALLGGEEVPNQVLLPTKLLVRQSCGCADPFVTAAAIDPLPCTLDESLEEGEESDFREIFSAQRDEILDEIVSVVQSYANGDVRPMAEHLTRALTLELDGVFSSAFLPTLREVLRRVVEDGGDAGGWQQAISVLRRRAFPCLHDPVMVSRAENLLHQARIMVGRVAERSQAYQALEAARRAASLNQLTQQMITTFDVEELIRILLEGLSQLAIKRCYLSLYEGEGMPPDRARLLVAYEQGKVCFVDSDGRRFLSRHLLLDDMLSQKEPYHLLVLPLHFADEQLGFLLLEMPPGLEMVYETLRGQISSALKGALLLRERERTEQALEQAYKEVEKRVEERTEELEQEIIERERAEAESRRLQQEIIEAQRQALQELSTPVIPVMEGIIVMPLIGSIDTLRARDITRALLAGIRLHQAQVVIVDITGVPIVDSGVASHLNRTIKAASLKGARTIITGISSAVAETIVDLGIDWLSIETLPDLQTGLLVALHRMGRRIVS
ncbi:MAG TPA: STAS domain-containing protein [Chloroflexi bacterium]|nr:STAS domain-containing protein [Chloroflexota bacterium]